MGPLRRLALVVVIGWIAWTALALYPPILFQRWCSPVRWRQPRPRSPPSRARWARLRPCAATSRATPTEAGSGENILTAVAVAFFVLLSILIGSSASDCTIYEDYAQSVIELGLIMGGSLAVCLITSCFVMSKYSRCIQRIGIASSRPISRLPDGEARPIPAGEPDAPPTATPVQKHLIPSRRASAILSPALIQMITSRCMNYRSGGRSISSIWR